MKNAVRERGAKLVIMDPRRQSLSRHAWRHLAFRPGTDVAMLNAMLHVIVTEGLTDEKLHPQPHREFRGAARTRAGLSAGGHGAPCGIPAETLREVAARLRTRRRGLDHLLGMGISQHVMAPTMPAA